MVNWKPVDVITVIITATICLFLLAILASAVVTGEKLTPQGLESLNKITHGLIGIIGVYVGSKLKG